MFFGKLLPREGNFFEMFNQHAKHVVETSKAFSSLVANYSDPSQREQYMNDVHRAEGAADRITTEVNQGDSHHLHHAYRPGTDSWPDQRHGRCGRPDSGLHRNDGAV
jgi:hypothetical protein